MPVGDIGGQRAGIDSQTQGGDQHRGRGDLHSQGLEPLIGCGLVGVLADLAEHPGDEDLPTTAAVQALAGRAEDVGRPFALVPLRLQLPDLCGTTVSMTGHRTADCGKTFNGLYLVLFDHGTMAMRYSTQVKPISYLKANAAEVLTHLTENRQPLVITQNGAAKAVLQDVATFEETQETLALLKILALGQQDVDEGRIQPVAAVVARLRAKRAAA